MSASTRYPSELSTEHSDSGERIIARQCVACRQLRPRNELIRVVYDRQGPHWQVILPGQVQKVVRGRSAYLCLTQACLSLALKGKKIHKTLKTSVPDDIVGYLNEILKGLETCGHS